MEQKKTKKGMAMAVVLIVLFVVTIIGFALASRGTQTLSTAFQSKENMLAHYAAQAGIANEMYDIEENKLPAPSTTCLGTDSLVPQTLTNHAMMTNQAVTFNNCPTTQTYNGTPIPPGMAYLTSTGDMSGTTKTLNELVLVSSWPFQGPLLSYKTQTDSQEVNSFKGTECGGTGALDNNYGNVGVNPGSGNSITLSGNASVGTVEVGSGATATLCSGCYTNETTLSNSIPIAPITDPTGGPGTSPPTVTGGVIPPGAYSSYSVSGTIQLECGQAYSFQSLTVSGSSVLEADCPATNPVRLYIYDSMTGNGHAQITNPTGGAAGFFVYGMPSPYTPSFTFDGTDSATFALYAPTGSFAINGGGIGTISGAVVANTISTGHSAGAEILYDECLQSSSSNLTKTPILESWISQ